MSSCQRIAVEQIVQSVHVCLFHSETPFQIHGFSQFLVETLLNDSLETSSFVFLQLTSAETIQLMSAAVSLLHM